MNPEIRVTPESFGHNVLIDMKIIRHGERTKEGELTDYGRQVTREKAAPNMIEGDAVDMVKPIGSNAGPKNNGQGRALETAAIFASEIAGETGVPRANDQLSYETMKSPTPYNHVAIYNSFLPTDFNDLDPQKKAEAAKSAQKSVVDHLMSLQTPEAIQYKKEAAGALASLVLHYEEVAKRLRSGSNVNIVAGTHGGTMEFLLQQSLVQENGGERKVGFDNLSAIGGEFHPSESYDVVVGMDESGQEKEIKVTFDDPQRPQKQMWLDREKVKELAEFYEKLHKNEKS